MPRRILELCYQVRWVVNISQVLIRKLQRVGSLPPMALLWCCLRLWSWIYWCHKEMQHAVNIFKLNRLSCLICFVLVMLYTSRCNLFDVNTVLIWLRLVVLYIYRMFYRHHPLSIQLHNQPTRSNMSWSNKQSQRPSCNQDRLHRLLSNLDKSLPPL